ncbi:RNA polymerase II transcriptional coactivator KELP-like [Hibiscus syriacus]|uniref:RNA polymerase II transcriptional coactivator KELP-like n=1 Tax=Hibiscus syriacus TaxID=106335 RepID=A0A6A2XTS3_HIBSY|nr:RNA polymerase II transcriptional coactivator KELP-like [Hibiscus syriacus]
MGNCSLKGGVHETNPIRVSTDAGQIIDCNGPKLAREITNDFPGYVICRRGQASTPLHEDERLLSGGAEEAGRVKCVYGGRKKCLLA